MPDFFQHPILQMAVAGFVSAATIDFGAFRSWKSIDEAYTYDWRVAIWRWFQGLVTGSLSGTVFQAMGA